MSETVTFKNKMNHPLPINLGNGKVISVAAKGEFTCTLEESKSPGVNRERGAKRIKLVKSSVVINEPDRPDPSAIHVPGPAPKQAIGPFEVGPNDVEKKSSQAEEPPPPVEAAGESKEEAPPAVTIGEEAIETSSEDEKSDDSLTSTTDVVESEGESGPGDVDAPKEKKKSRRKKSSKKGK